MTLVQANTASSQRSRTDRTRPATPGTDQRGWQGTFDELGEPLYETTFVVVDLETTGGSPRNAVITEIGAVKVRGGVVLGEFQTFVNAGVPVPAFISSLTGITDSMLTGQPSVGEAIASFLAFAGNGVIVAHNAQFDVGFLKAACADHGYEWPDVEVVDTVALARVVVTRDEAPNHKLATLARLFHAEVTPDHRALSDARATVDVLHALLERHAARGVTHRSDLQSACARVPDAVRQRRTLADGLPTGPGVYIFRSVDGRALYVGRSERLRSRVRQYFTAAESRKRMAEMVRLTHHVDAVACATTLEAQVRELRLIAELQPQYNRRSKRQHSPHWVTLTREDHPRLSVTRRPPAPGVAAIGPVASARSAQRIVESIVELYDIRTCTAKLPAVPADDASACARQGIGRCSAPCVVSESGHRDQVEAVAELIAGSPQDFIERALGRIDELARGQRYEAAADQRDRLRSVLVALDHAAWHRYLSTTSEIAAIHPSTDGAFVHVDLLQHGRHVAAIRTDVRADLSAAIHAVRLTAEAASVSGPSAEEVAIAAQWLQNAQVTAQAPSGASAPFGNPAALAIRTIFGGG